MDRRGRGGAAREAGSPAAAFARPLAASLALPIHELITIELAAYVAVLVLGLATRIGHLDAYPLNLDEATRALSGWQLVQGMVAESWREPLIILTTAISFLVAGDNDVMARLAPVVAGSALILLPWLLREQIGQSGALLASLFLAVSPTFVLYSRTLSGDIFAATLSMGLLVAVVRYVSERQAQWAIIGGGLIGLLLNAGAPGISFLLVFVAFFAIVAALGKGSNEYVQAWESLKADRGTLRQVVTVLVGGFVLVGSGFLGNLAGLKFPALGAWLAEFNLTPDGQPWYFHLELLLGYEPLIVLAGVAGAAYYVFQWQKGETRRSVGIKGLLIFWAVGGLLAAAFTGVKHGGQLLVPLIPLALLAGSLAGDLAGRLNRRWSITKEGVAIAGAPFLVYALLVVSQLTQRGLVAVWYQWMLAVLALVLVAVLVVASVAYGGRHTGHFAAFVGLALLLAYSVHTTWQTVYDAPEAEPLISSVTSKSLVDAVDEIEEMPSAGFLGKTITIAVEPGLGLPIRWYLRNHSSVQYATKPKQGTLAIFWQVDQPPDVNLQEYYARKANLATSWSSRGGKPGELWRWLLYREPFGTTNTRQMMLYLHR